MLKLFCNQINGELTMDVKDRIEDYVEYLVDCNAVTDLRDLSQEEKKKLE